jgi:hypothetical protein
MAVSTLVTAIGIAAAGVAAVAAVSWAFYLVGRSEDRDRASRRGPANAAGRQVQPGDPASGQPEPAGPRRGLRHRLARRRGAQD